MFLGEAGYLALIKKVIREGETRVGRNGNTISLFGEQLRFSLRDREFPLLTSKFVPFRLVHEELKWFINGKTDNKSLLDQNVKIWDANAKAGPLWQGGEDEDLGPIYGYQWRHFGGKYSGCKEESNPPGVDQISWIVNELRERPGSRRAILSAWNPVDIPNMTLPPCHVLSQYWIGKNGLSCHLYQRSADIGLGVPFNIASYALLTYAFAKALNVPTNELVMSFGDSHIYEEHASALEKLTDVTPNLFPTISIESDSNDPVEIVTNGKIQIEGYKHNGRLRLPMIA